MSNRSLPSTFVKNVGQNGVGRYVCQLQRLTIKFCKTNASSRGVRDFIENYLLDFTRNNPGIVIYLKPRRHRGALLQAEYLNGNLQKIEVNNMNMKEVCKWVEFARTRSGVDIMRLRKTWHTDTPSIQGVWHPFMNKDPAMNITKFPDPNVGKFVSNEINATQRVLQLAKKLKNLNIEENSDSTDSVVKKAEESDVRETGESSV